MEAGKQSYKMKITSGKESIELSDIVIGDVWICSGQSNMEFELKKANNASQEIAQANDTFIRHFKVPKSSAETPEKTLAGGTWATTSPQTAGEFTAVGYFFARNISYSFAVLSTTQRTCLILHLFPLSDRNRAVTGPSRYRRRCA